MTSDSPNTADIVEAKRLLREKLSAHPNEGVRTLNEMVELADDNPSVLRIAAALKDHRKAQA